MYKKISLRYFLAVISAVIVFLGSTFTFVSQVNPAHAATGPCGKWVTKSGFTLSKGNPIKIKVRAFPCKSGDPSVSQVFIGWVNPGVNDFYNICTISSPDPGTTDTFSCNTDGFSPLGKYPPNGPIDLGFAANPSSGCCTIFNPDGLISGTFGSGSTATPTPSPSPTQTPVVDPKKQLFVFVAGINSALSRDDISQKLNNGYGYASDFMDSDKIVPYLKTHGYKYSRYIVFSYSGYHNGGKPDPYTCEVTHGKGFKKDALLTLARRLALQINAAVKGHPNTQINLIDHSQGGLIAFIYTAALIEKTGDVAPLPRNGSRLRIVVPEDSPLGGVSSATVYTSAIVAGIIRTCDPLVNFSQTIAEMQVLFKSANDTFHIGASASVMGSILHRKVLTNQEVADDAKAQGITIMSVGNAKDMLYAPDLCYPTSNFVTSQLLQDEGNQSEAVYSRYITDGTKICEKGVFTLLNHKEVLKNEEVFIAIEQLLRGIAPFSLVNIAV